MARTKRKDATTESYINLVRLAAAPQGTPVTCQRRSSFQVRQTERLKPPLGWIFRKPW
jgi:hypothetical protein